MSKVDNFKNKGVRFGSGQNPTNGGRPKNICNILKEHGYSGNDMKTAFSEMAWYTLGELKEVFTDESKPIIMRIVANQFYTAFKQANFTKVKEILEHVIGKPSQPLNMSNDNDTGIVIVKLLDNGRT